MSECEIITIGNELLNGSTLNTNARYLGRVLGSLNLGVTHQSSCLDSEEAVVDALSLAFSRSDLVIATGGLGPTPDDVTREAVARFLRSPLVRDAAQQARIIRYFRRLGRRTPPMTEREAMRPEISKPLLNRFGIALGFYVERSGCLLIVLPGVPKELERMFEHCVRGMLAKRFKAAKRVHVLEARITGLYETEVMKRLGKRFFRHRKFEFGIYPDTGEVTIRIKTIDHKLLQTLQNELKKRLGFRLYALGHRSLAAAIQEKLIRRKQTLAVAESCTGGLLTKEMTDEPGASKILIGGVVAYSNRVKIGLLNVNPALLRRHGAVSAQAARAMARGARERFKSGIGIAVTGVAGPSGGSRRKPVGTVYIALADGARTETYRYRFGGDRDSVRKKAAAKAKELLWKWLHD